MTAVLLALAAAAIFGLLLHVQARGLETLGGLPGALVSVTAMAVLFWSSSPLWLEPAWFGTRAAAIFVFCGLVWPALAMLFQILAVRSVGPALSAAAGAFAPVFAIVPAVAVLGEHVTARTLIGISVMIAGLLQAAFLRGGGRFGRAQLALLLPLGASLTRGIAQPTAKFAMQEVPEPVFATAVMAAVSTLVLAVAVSVAGRWGEVLRPVRGHLHFAVAGAMVGAGILAVNAALGAGRVVVVSPLVATTPLWALALSAWVFRKETLGWRHAVVAALVFAGSVLVVLG